MKYLKCLLIAVCTAALVGCQNDRLTQCLNDYETLKAEYEQTKAQHAQQQQAAADSTFSMMSDWEKCEEKLKEMTEKRKTERAELDKLLKSMLQSKDRIKQLDDQLDQSKQALAQISDLMKQQEEATQKKHQDEIKALQDEITQLKAQIEDLKT